jgi:hypothetical protein
MSILATLSLAAVCAQAKPQRHPLYEPDGKPVAGKRRRP